MEIGKSTENDVPTIMRIYAAARRFMAEHGNPNQWGPTNWPPERLIRSDIALGESYVCRAGGRIVGTFCFRMGADAEPAYRAIEQGSWRDPRGRICVFHPCVLSFGNNQNNFQKQLCPTGIP